MGCERSARNCAKERELVKSERNHAPAIRHEVHPKRHKKARKEDKEARYQEASARGDGRDRVNQKVESAVAGNKSKKVTAVLRVLRPFNELADSETLELYRWHYCMQSVRSRRNEN